MRCRRSQGRIGTAQGRTCDVNMSAVAPYFNVAAVAIPIIKTEIRVDAVITRTAEVRTSHQLGSIGTDMRYKEVRALREGVIFRRYLLPRGKGGIIRAGRHPEIIRSRGAKNV